MGDLGAVGTEKVEVQRLTALFLVNRVFPSGGHARVAGGSDTASPPPFVPRAEPQFQITTTPAPPGGVGVALACLTPGSFRRLRQVDAGTTVTVTVKARVTARFLVHHPTDALAYGWSHPRQVTGLDGAKQLSTGVWPRLVVQREDGVWAEDVFDAAADAWDTLSVSMPVGQTGLLRAWFFCRGPLGLNSTWAVLGTPLSGIAHSGVWPGHPIYYWAEPDVTVA